MKYEKYRGFEQIVAPERSFILFKFFISNIYLSKMNILNLLKNYTLSKKLITI
jgi:hypothetical protein